MNSEYALVSRWQVACSRDDLWDAVDALLASDDPMVWWPSVQVTAYDGSSMRVRVASTFGYSLRFTLADLVASRPTSLTFTAEGDLTGRGEVSIEAGGAHASTMEIDWRVTTDRPWMRRTGWLLRPAFVLAHRIVMRQGERRFGTWLAAEGWRAGGDMV